MNTEIADLIAEIEKEEEFDEIVTEVTAPFEELTLDNDAEEIVEINVPEEELIEDDVLVETMLVPTPTFNVGDEVMLTTNATFASGNTIPKSLFNIKLYVCAEKNGNYAVGQRRGGKVLGSIKPEHLIPYETTTSIASDFKKYLILINEEKAMVKSRPEESSKTLITLPYNGLYTVIGEHNDWCHLKIGGWIPMSAVTKI